MVDLFFIYRIVLTRKILRKKKVLKRQISESKLLFMTEVSNSKNRRTLMQHSDLNDFYCICFVYEFVVCIYANLVKIHSSNKKSRTFFNNL